MRSPRFAPRLPAKVARSAGLEDSLFTMRRTPGIGWRLHGLNYGCKNAAIGRRLGPCAGGRVAAASSRQRHRPSSITAPPMLWGSNTFRPWSDEPGMMRMRQGSGQRPAMKAWDQGLEIGAAPARPLSPRLRRRGGAGGRASLRRIAWSPRRGRK
jgi:hypothetical protein